MKHYRYLFFFFISILFSCKAKDTTPAEIRQELKAAMQTSLYQRVNFDSTNVKYYVENVSYFEEPDKYICEFTVRMKEKLFDTTGIMRANISKDFKKVARTY
jgi:hypothetical protein